MLSLCLFKVLRGHIFVNVLPWNGNFSWICLAYDIYHSCNFVEQFLDTGITPSEDLCIQGSSGDICFRTGLTTNFRGMRQKLHNRFNQRPMVVGVRRCKNKPLDPLVYRQVVSFRMQAEVCLETIGWKGK